MVSTVKAMTAVDSQPITQSGRGRVNFPITCGRIVCSRFKRREHVECAANQSSGRDALRRRPNGARVR